MTVRWTGTFRSINLASSTVVTEIHLEDVVAPWLSDMVIGDDWRFVLTLPGGAKVTMGRHDTAAHLAEFLVRNGTTIEGGWDASRDDDDDSKKEV